MDQLEAAKYVGAFCGALLIYLLTVTAADALFTVGDGGHGAHGEAHHDDGHGGDKVAAMPASIYALEEATTETATEEVSITDLLAAADLGKGEKVFAKCKACHALDDGANGVGPHLFAVVDRGIGGVGGYSYSSALAGLGGAWDYAALDGFLANPKKYAPGTKMSFAGLKKATDRANLIAYLDTIK